MRSPEAILSDIRALTEELSQALEAPRVPKHRRALAPPPEQRPSQDSIDKVRRKLRKNGVAA